jgi:hypothetical protein
VEDFEVRHAARVNFIGPADMLLPGKCEPKYRTYLKIFKARNFC